MSCNFFFPQSCIQFESLSALDYEARKDPKVPGNLICLTGEAHANRRRLWNRGMSSDSLREYEDIIVRRANQLIERLEGISGVVDLAAWLGYFTCVPSLPCAVWRL